MHNPYIATQLWEAERAVREAYDLGYKVGCGVKPDEEVERLRRVLRLIAAVDQGCGGNLSFEEMARSAMRQARDALETLETVRGCAEYEAHDTANCFAWDAARAALARHDSEKERDA